MNKNELEQSLMFAEKRLLELGDRMAALEKENQILQSTNEELRSQINRISEHMSQEVKSIDSGMIQDFENRSYQLNGVIETLREECNNRISNLSNELYKYIEKQDKQLSTYVDMLKKESDNRTLSLSDELYQYISKQNGIRDKELQEYKKQLNDELWMRTYGFDNLISELQLTLVEHVFPGNRTRLENLKNSHKGEKCFVIGNGPSLSVTDLEILKKNNVFCFGSNGIFHIFKETDWRPDVWGASDLAHIAGNAEQISDMNGIIKLLCTQTVTKLGFQIKDAIYFPFIQSKRTPAFFNLDVTRGVHFYGTVTCKLINFAMYMGFEEIYLLGVDNSYGLKKDENGKYMYDIKANNHFTEKYLSDEAIKVCENIDDIIGLLEYGNSSYNVIKWHCDNMGIKVFNATRGGKLETFPRVDMDMLFE